MYDKDRVNRFAGSATIPWVVYEAAIYLYQHIAEWQRVFEWGSGASTFFFAKHAQSLTSVEHDEIFYNRIASVLQANGIDKVNYMLQPPKEEDLPKDARKPTSFRSDATGKCYREYVEKIDQYIDDSFDMVVVDGRARPSCLIRALPKVKAGGCLMLDNSDKKKYFMAMKMVPKTWKRMDFCGWGRKDPTRPCALRKELMNWKTTIWRKPHE